MKDNIDEPLSIEELAHRTKMSNRQIQRHFRDAIGMTMAKFYVKLRLKRAHELLLQTDISVYYIMMACGFQSMSHFRKSYHREVKHPPSAERRK